MWDKIRNKSTGDTLLSDYKSSPLWICKNKLTIELEIIWKMLTKCWQDGHVDKCFKIVAIKTFFEPKCRFDIWPWLIAFIGHHHDVSKFIKMVHIQKGPYWQFWDKRINGPWSDVVEPYGLYSPVTVWIKIVGRTGTSCKFEKWQKFFSVPKEKMVPS